MFDRNLRRGEANVIGVYALGFVLGGLSVFIGCGDLSADDDADVGDDVVSDVDVLQDVDVLMDVDDDVGEADVDTVGETETAAVCGNGVLEDGEECDDANDVSGDGCEPDTCVFSCHEDDDCLEIPEDDPCTVNSCEGVTGGQACRSAPNEGASCDDGDSCTEDDRCDDAGICRAGTNVCHCPGGTTEECAAHEDGNLCNGTLVCNPETRLCEVNPETVVTCPADEPCRTHPCDPETGGCLLIDRAEGHSCTPDAFACTDDVCDGGGTCIHRITDGWCLIGGDCHENGETEPWNPCRSCDVSTTRTAWTNRPVGYSCDDGLFCSGTETCNASGACVSTGDPCPESCRACNEGTGACDVVEATCWIAGACWTDGAVRPGYPCQVCESTTSRTAWSNRPDGSSCDDGLWCNGSDACDAAGACVAGTTDRCPETCRTCNEGTDGCDLVAGFCWVDGACWADGVSRPWNLCQFCDAAGNPGTWTHRPVGYSCDDGLFCTGPDACSDAGTCLSAGDPCPESCRTCNEALDRCDVATGCWIEGACYAEGAVRPGYPCQYCSGSSSRTSWTSRAVGYSCDDGLFCNGVDTCNASGACVSAGDPCPEACRTCNEGTGACDVTTGCWISGACWADGAQRPGNPCQYCDAGAGRTAWTGRPTGYSCDDGVFCNGAETCSAEHVCTPGTPVPDLTECRTAADEAGVCRSAVCVAIECGNALVDPGEACDDGGTDACDGCSPSCRWSYSLEPGVGGYARVADSPSIAALTGAHTIEA
jgi:cysteine-rich repeat protein